MVGRNPNKANFHMPLEWPSEFEALGLSFPPPPFLVVQRLAFWAIKSM